MLLKSANAGDGSQRWRADWTTDEEGVADAIQTKEEEK
jgi:hypothetical protein